MAHRAEQVDPVLALLARVEKLVEVRPRPPALGGHEAQKPGHQRHGYQHEVPQAIDDELELENGDIANQRAIVEAVLGFGCFVHHVPVNKIRVGSDDYTRTGWNTAPLCSSVGAEPGSRRNYAQIPANA